MIPAMINITPKQTILMQNCLLFIFFYKALNLKIKYFESLSKLIDSSDIIEDFFSTVSRSVIFLTIVPTLSFIIP